MKIEERLKVFEDHIKRAEENYKFLKVAPDVAESIVEEADSFLKRLNEEYEKLKMELIKDDN